jgi:dihydroorotate dehydrogenase electron transfer subunit
MIPLNKMIRQSYLRVLSNEEILPEIYLLWLEAGEFASLAQPGQFISVKCGDLTLRRPFSIYDIANGKIGILFQKKGNGTNWLAQCRINDKLDILGPLGTGFTFNASSKNLLLLAGGVGIAPLIFLIRSALEKHSIVLAHGAADNSMLMPQKYIDSVSKDITPESIEGSTHLPADIKSLKYVTITEDGSSNRKGTVIDLLTEYINWADQLYICGPIGMYNAISSLLENSYRGPVSISSTAAIKHFRSKISSSQVSLEVRMGCGTGGCYGCSIKTKHGMKKVCFDGPIFQFDDILWDKVLV